MRVRPLWQHAIMKEWAVRSCVRRSVVGCRSVGASMFVFCTKWACDRNTVCCVSAGWPSASRESLLILITLTHVFTSDQNNVSSETTCSGLSVPGFADVFLDAADPLADPCNGGAAACAAATNCVAATEGLTGCPFAFAVDAEPAGRLLHVCQCGRCRRESGDIYGSVW